MGNERFTFQICPDVTAGFDGAATMIWVFSLLLVAVYPFIALYATFRIARRQTGTRRKIGVAILSLAVFAIAPILDELVGRFYFSYLCTYKAGLTVYQQVELPGEYWNEDGTPTFVKPDGDLDEEKLGNNYHYEWKSGPSHLFNIKEDVDRIIDVKGETVLAKYIEFIYWRGWLVTHLSMHVSGVRCMQMHDLYVGLLSKVFVRSSIR